MGEGSAAFLLKRLDDAERDGDKIYAVIRGVGGSSDGKGKGITAPNPVGQVLAIQRAWENAGLDPATATLVEAHGTSTKVGDVVEVESLSKVFGGATAEQHRAGIGEEQHRPSEGRRGRGGLAQSDDGAVSQGAAAHVELPSDQSQHRFQRDALLPQSRSARRWDAAKGAPRRVGVSAYGFGGTNFHLRAGRACAGHVEGRTKVYAGAAVNWQDSNGQVTSMTR